MCLVSFQNGNECWCGNDYGLVNGVKDPLAQQREFQDCNTNCAGDSSQLCGGSGLMSIFKIDGARALWATGQPNNALDFNNPSKERYQTCAALDANANFRWADERCHDKNFAMCDIISK